MNILDKIILDKKIEIKYKKQETPISSLPFIYEASPCFLNALKKRPIGFIAELKKKSPSAGILRDPYDPVSILKSYEKNGATAISCLIDNLYFGGSDEIFKCLRNQTTLPMLYKEFVIDEWQIAHAKSLGASGILLIAAVLDQEKMSELMHCSKKYGLTPLVEIHNEKEADIAIKLGADCIGINNRDLKSFETSIDVTFNIFKNIPDHVTVVSESGIKTSNDVERLEEIGVDAILVGETLLKDKDPGLAILDLLAKL